MNHLCLAFDRLHAGYLGCFGNTWIATPAFDRFAADALLFHQAHVDTTDATEAYESLWRGTHRLERLLRPYDPPRPALAEAARAAGLHTLLVTDDPSVGGHAAGAAFDDALVLEGPEGEVAAAAGVDETHTARFFAAAIDRLADVPEPFFAWIHARSLAGAWDAPPEFRDRYVEEDDPPAPTFTRLERRELPADVDLDERFGLSQAYAAQIALLDVCLGGLLEHLDERGLDERTNVGLLSVRGLALGEHSAVGPWDDRLQAETVRVPWLLRPADRRIARCRSQALVQPADWYAAWVELVGGAADQGRYWSRSVLPSTTAGPSQPRDRAVVVGRTETGIAVPGWYLRRCGDPDGAGDALYVKPDDFWEANDVAARCADVAASLRALDDAVRRAVADGVDPPPLADDDVLVVGAG